MVVPAGEEAAGDEATAVVTTVVPTETEVVCTEAGQLVTSGPQEVSVISLVLYSTIVVGCTGGVVVWTAETGDELGFETGTVLVRVTMTEEVVW